MAGSNNEPSTGTRKKAKPPARGLKKYLRLKAIVPLVIFLVLAGAVWLLLLDSIVRRGVEWTGSQLTGARVDVAEAEVRPFAGRFVLRGIAAADPEAPMRNLIEIGEAVADVRLGPLLEKKIIIDTLAVTGVRFGTPRTESGALERRSATTGAAARRFSTWTRDLPIPAFSLRGLGEAVNVSAISADSLRTVRLANRLVTEADSLQEHWTAELSDLDVSAEIDSTRALLERSGEINLRRISLRQIEAVRDLVVSGRDLVRSLQAKRDRLTELSRSFQDGWHDLRDGLGSLDEARDVDYDWARSQLRIPSIEAPDLGPALFGEMARDHLAPVLRALDTVEEHLPPGLKQKLEPGPKRLRLAGTTVRFPRRAELPALLLERGEFSMSLGPADRPEAYELLVTGLTTEPAVYGEPTRFRLARASGGAGERTLQVTGTVDHTTEVPHDTVTVALAGAGMGEVALGSLSGRLDLGTGESMLRLTRSGPELDALMTWECSALDWVSTGQRSRLEQFVWETLAGLDRLSLEIRASGLAEDPRLRVTSNIAGTLSRALQDRLGAEIRRAEAEVRRAVNERIASYEARARSEIDAVRSGVEERIGELEGRLDEVKAELEARLRRLTDALPPGIIPP